MIKILGKNLLMEQVEIEMSSVIEIPDLAKQKSTYQRHGKVIAFGADVVQVKLGDVVIITPYAGKHFKLDGEKYIIASEKEILAVLEQE